MTIELEEARKIIHEITEKRKPIAEFAGGDVQILNGPYGPYIKDLKNKKNARLPKDRDPKTITEDEALQMLADAPERKKAAVASPKRVQRRHRKNLQQKRKQREKGAPKGAYHTEKHLSGVI